MELEYDIDSRDRRMIIYFFGDTIEDEFLNNMYRQLRSMVEDYPTVGGIDVDLSGVSDGGMYSWDGAMVAKILCIARKRGNMRISRISPDVARAIDICRLGDTMEEYMTKEARIQYRFMVGEPDGELMVAGSSRVA
ncbi:MAG: hypothetical protein DRO99_03865 [Candidatus Aenigmatarchaeota archaeon]|nr:MAG: hypothetical protein DRO99_03865 [Candidatus Aenigmarchaeota archaeon]